MSRSYKKTPVYTDFSRFRTKYFKRKANHATRRLKDIGNYSDYKKHYNGWNIHDWVSLWTIDDARQSYQNVWWSSREECWKPLWDEYENEEEFLNHHWAKYYKRK